MPFVDPYLAEPYSFWMRAREAEPVFYSAELDYWVVTRYEDIKAIFADPATFSASIAQTPVKPLAPEVLRLLQGGGFRAKPTMSNADPPAHTRVRKFAWQAFTPKRVAELEPDMRRLVTRYIDQIEGAGPGGPRAPDVLRIAGAGAVSVLRNARGRCRAGEDLVAQTPDADLGYALRRAADGARRKGCWNTGSTPKPSSRGCVADPPDNYVGDLIRVSHQNEIDLSIARDHQRRVRPADRGARDDDQHVRERDRHADAASRSLGSVVR